MAGVVYRSRLSACLASQCTCRNVVRRGFATSARQRAAQNFSMPALSPTMTEGNISKWRIKEGDSYAAGDVLLEIETDKASMDVEAQDDGVLFKIMQQDGAKGVKVGARIAVIAEEGDDLSSLEVPRDDSKAAQPEKKKEQPAQKEEPKPETSATAAAKSDTKPQTGAQFGQGSAAQNNKVQSRKYPLFPSVQQLLHENNLSKEDADQIPASGPNGRLLKGDVLAYLGKINKDAPAKLSDRLTKLSHLDLSNIQLAKPAPKPEAAKPADLKEENIELPAETELAIPISLSAVIATQKKVQDKLGIFLPLSTFIARASELANDDLPPSKNKKKPTADDLFNRVLGLDQVANISSRGNFIPEVTGLSPPPFVAAPQSTKKPDIIDMLASKKAKSNQPAFVRSAPVGVATGDNIFSVVAKPGEENRAMEYLERMKIALEKEPGRLIL